MNTASAPLASSIAEALPDIAAAAPPGGEAVTIPHSHYQPKARFWDVLESGCYDKHDGTMSVAYCDIVSDSFLYHLSGGQRGKSTIYQQIPNPTPPDKAGALQLLQNHAFREQRSAELAAELAAAEEGKSGRQGEGEKEVPTEQRRTFQRGIGIGACEDWLRSLGFNLRVTSNVRESAMEFMQRVDEAAPAAGKKVAFIEHPCSLEFEIVVTPGGGA